MSDFDIEKIENSQSHIELSKFGEFKAQYGKGILCLISFFLYQFFMALFGYAYEDSSTFWVSLVLSLGLGGWYGYKGQDSNE